MSYRSIYRKVHSRRALEKQLRVEEDFLVAALQKIKEQRQYLMAERVFLEDYKELLMEATAKGGPLAQGKQEKGEASAQQVPNPTPGNSAAASTDANTPGTSKCIDYSRIAAIKARIKQEWKAKENECAGPSSARPIFVQEEPDTNAEEESSDEYDEDDLIVDMNTFMHGDPKQE